MRPARSLQPEVPSGRSWRVSGDEIDALEELVEAWPHVGKVGALRVISHVISWR